MPECHHRWEMTDVRFGFVVFEKCIHCNALATYFTTEVNPILGDKYRDGDCFWNRVENAQSFQFNLRCTKCGQVVKFNDLMGFLHCTGCLANCQVDILQKRLEAERTWVLVAFGFLHKDGQQPIPQSKLDVLTDYFNQRRDTTRSRIKILSFELIENLSQCRGDFIHDVGMLSTEPPKERQHLF